MGTKKPPWTSQPRVDKIDKKQKFMALNKNYVTVLFMEVTIKKILGHLFSSSVS